MFKELSASSKRKANQSIDNGRSIASGNVATVPTAVTPMSNQPELALPQNGRSCKMRSMLLKLHSEMEPSSVQSVMQKLTYISKTNALRFQLLGDDAKRRTKECSLNAAHFCVYFTLDVSPNGSRNAFIEDVRVQLSNDVAQSCPELLEALRANKYDVLVQQVANLQSIYALKVDGSQKNLAYACLNAFEKDLVTLFNATTSYFTAELQSSTTPGNTPSNAVNERLAHRLVFQGPVGCFQPRSGGRPATVTYFVSAYDLIDVATQKMRPLTLETIQNYKVGKSAYVTIEPSTNGSMQRLALVPLLSGRVARQSVSSTPGSRSSPNALNFTNLGITCAPASPMNTAVLPAYFVLDLRGTLVATQLVAERIEKITELSLARAADTEESFVQAVVDFASTKRTGTDTDADADAVSTPLDAKSASHVDCDCLMVRIREQRHCYSLSASSDVRLFEPALVRGVHIRKVAFTRVSDLPAILSVIRAQTVLNALLESLVRSNTCSKRVSADWRVIRARVEYDSLTSLRCVFADPFRADAFASISVNLSEYGAPRCSLSDAKLVRILESGRVDETGHVEPIASINDYLDAVLARSYSLPILVHAVYHRAARIAAAQCGQQLAAECARIESDTAAHIEQVRRHNDAIGNSGLLKRQTSYAAPQTPHAHYGQSQLAGNFAYGHSPNAPATPSGGYGMLSPLRMAVPNSPTTRTPFSTTSGSSQRGAAPLVSPVLQNILAGNSSLPPQSPLPFAASQPSSYTLAQNRGAVDAFGKNERNPVLTSLLNQDGDGPHIGAGSSVSPSRRPSGGTLDQQQLQSGGGAGRGKKRKASTAQSDNAPIGDHAQSAKRRMSKHISALNDDSADAYSLGTALSGGVAHSKLLPAVLTSTSLQHSAGAASAYGCPPPSPGPSGPLSRLLSSNSPAVLAPPPPVNRSLSTSSNLDDTFADVLSSIRSPDEQGSTDEDTGGQSRDSMLEPVASEPSSERYAPAESASFGSITSSATSSTATTATSVATSVSITTAAASTTANANLATTTTTGSTATSTTGSVLKGTKLIIPKNLSGLTSKAAPVAAGAASNGGTTVTVIKRDRVDDNHSLTRTIEGDSRITSNIDALSDMSSNIKKVKAPVGTGGTSSPIIKKRIVDADDASASSANHADISGPDAHIIVKKKLGRPRKIDATGSPLKKLPFVSQSSVTGSSSAGGASQTATPPPTSAIRITIRDANRDKLKPKIEKKVAPLGGSASATGSSNLSTWDAQSILVGQSANTDKLKNFRIPKKVKTADDVAAGVPKTPATNAAVTTTPPTPTTPAPGQLLTNASQSQSQPETPESAQPQSQTARAQSRSAPFDSPSAEQRSNPNNSGGRAPLLPTPAFAPLSTSPSQRAYGQVAPAHVNRVGRSPGHTQSPLPYAHDTAPLSRSNSVGNGGAVQPINLSTHPHTAYPKAGAANGGPTAASNWSHPGDAAVQPSALATTGKSLQRDTAEIDAGMQQASAQRGGRKQLESVIDKLRTKSISGTSADATQQSQPHSQAEVRQNAGFRNTPAPQGALAAPNRRILREAEKDTPDSPAAAAASAPASPDPDVDAATAPARTDSDFLYARRAQPSASASSNLVRVLVSNAERPHASTQRFVDEPEIDSDRLTIVDEVGSMQAQSHAAPASESEAGGEIVNTHDSRRGDEDSRLERGLALPSGTRQSASLSMLTAYSESSSESVD